MSARSGPSAVDQRERALIGEVALLLAADRTPRETFAGLCELLTRWIDVSVCFVALRNGASLRVEFVNDHGEMQADPEIMIVQRDSRSWETMHSGRSQLFHTLEDWRQHPRFPLSENRPWTDDTVSAIFVPLQAAGDRLGVLSVQSQNEHAYDETDVALLEAIARYLGIALRNQRLFARLQRVAEVDPLTGLANHSTVLRAIDERLAALDQTLGIVLLDITNFGRLNDVYGTRAGDRVLDMLAERLASLADERTLVGRFGGDDFVLVAQRDDRDELSRLVLEATERTADLSFRGDGVVIPVSVNIGWVTAPDEGATRSDLLALAELRLRASIEQGGAPIGEALAPQVRFGSFGAVDPLVECALVRDPYTRMHLLHVNHLANAWSPLLGLDDAAHETFIRAALLHDIGKLLVPDAILLKPARLDSGEYATMQRHAEYGRAILSDYDGFGDVARVIGEHHERWDGRGYPNRVAGEAIDPLARAVSVIDAYSAMTLDRPYHRAIPNEEALAELERCAGTQFDPAMVASFAAMVRAQA